MPGRACNRKTKHPSQPATRVHPCGRLAWGLHARGYVMSSAKEKSFSFFPMLLTLIAAGALAALAVRFYRRPWETTRDVIRAGMLLAGITDGTGKLDGVCLHFYLCRR